MSQETIIELSRAIAALSEEVAEYRSEYQALVERQSGVVKDLQAESDGYFNERNAALSKLQEAQDTIGALRLEVKGCHNQRRLMEDSCERLHNTLQILTDYTGRYSSALAAFKTVRFPKSRGKGITIEVETVAGIKRRFTFTTAAHRAHAILLAHQTIYRDEAKVGGGRGV